jgi:hypothetical protein
MNRAPRSTYLSIVRNTARAILGERRAHHWLAAPNERLGGFAPLSVASDLKGAQRVLAELDRTGGKGTGQRS